MTKSGCIWFILGSSIASRAYRCETCGSYMFLLLMHTRSLGTLIQQVKVVSKHLPLCFVLYKVVTGNLLIVKGAVKMRCSAGWDILIVIGLLRSFKPLISPSFMPIRIGGPESAS